MCFTEIPVLAVMVVVVIHVSIPLCTHSRIGYDPVGTSTRSEDYVDIPLVNNVYRDTI